MIPSYRYMYYKGDEILQESNLLLVYPTINCIVLPEQDVHCIIVWLDSGMYMQLAIHVHHIYIMYSPVTTCRQRGVCGYRRRALVVVIPVIPTFWHSNIIIRERNMKQFSMCEKSVWLNMCIACWHQEGRAHVRNKWGRGDYWWWCFLTGEVYTWWQVLSVHWIMMLVDVPRITCSLECTWWLESNIPSGQLMQRCSCHARSAVAEVFVSPFLTAHWCSFCMPKINQTVQYRYWGSPCRRCCTQFKFSVPSGLSSSIKQLSRFSVY